MDEDRGLRSPRIKVIGAGGAGGRAVGRMISASLERVDLVAADTDLQALERCRAATRVAIGRELTRGLDAGGDGARGRRAAQEDLPTASTTTSCRTTSPI